MKDRKTVSMKTVALLVALVLIVSCAAGGTFAWLMTKTETITNVFTVGDIELKLQEHVLDPNTGEATGELTDVGQNNIPVLPGRKIEKDPFVTVVKGSEPCYVRVFMIVNWTEEADAVFRVKAYEDWLTMSTGWTAGEYRFDGSYGTNGQYVGTDIVELRYNGIVDATDANVVLPIMESITFGSNLSLSDVAALEGCSLSFVAQAVQAETFGSASDAFAVCDIPVTAPSVPALPEEP